MTTGRRTGHHSRVDYPELAARTRRFSYGAPRAVSVSADGDRVIFLRSTGPEDPVDRLWVYDVGTGIERLVGDPDSLAADTEELPAEERALRERLRLSAAGIGSYALDAAAAVAVFSLAGHLYRADLRTGDRLLTSGLDGTYPPGLAVAQITDVVRDAGQMFARIVCKPLAGIDHSEFLLVLSQSAALPPRPEEAGDAEAAKKGGRGKGRR